MSNSIKRRKGFEGEKLITIPPKIWKGYLSRHPSLFNIYITHIGYFPKASYHYRERRTGCDDNILIYCLQGKGYYVADNKRFEVKPNQYFLLPATDECTRYWADVKDPWTIYWIHFTGTVIQNFNDSLNINVMKGPVQIPFNVKALDIWDKIYQSLEMGYSIENLCNANFCLYHLLAAFLFPDKHIEAEKNEQEDVIKNSIINMKESLDAKLTVEDMALRHHLSTSHFSMMFRKSTGMPPIDYFIHLKMQKACQLLYANGSKIKDVAQELGYEDPYYFSRLFKKFMGLSPEQYKMSNNKRVEELKIA